MEVHAISPESSRATGPPADDPREKDLRRQHQRNELHHLKLVSGEGRYQYAQVDSNDGEDHEQDNNLPQSALLIDSQGQDSEQ